MSPGYVPPSFGHFVENTGNTTLTYLELFNAGNVILFIYLLFHPDHNFLH